MTEKVIRNVGSTSFTDITTVRGNKAICCFGLLESDFDRNGRKDRRGKSDVGSKSKVRRMENVKCKAIRQDRKLISEYNKVHSRVLPGRQPFPGKYSQAIIRFRISHYQTYFLYTGLNVVSSRALRSSWMWPFSVEVWPIQARWSLRTARKRKIICLQFFVIFMPLPINDTK